MSLLSSFTESGHRLPPEAAGDARAPVRTGVDASGGDGSAAGHRPPDGEGLTGAVEPPPVAAGDAETWDEQPSDDEAMLAGDETTALVGSVLVHLIVILLLALFPLRERLDDEAVVIVSSPPDYEQDVELIEEITYSDVPQTEMGAGGEAELELAEASAEMFAEVNEIPKPIDLEPTDLGRIKVNKMFEQAVAPLDRLENQKGKVGQGTEGVSGAVDRITFEILQAVEDRPTLVVWLFDQSGSLHRQREQIRDRFERIYEELGVAAESGLGPLGRNQAEIPILTSIVGFGSDVTLYTEAPTDDLEQIKSVVNTIEVDDSGVERVFTAVESAANEFKTYRKSRGPFGPQRNVLFVVVTDERGDDYSKLEPTIATCRKWGIPVYVIGVPAPFGREHTYVKYVDPDPNFDQTPQWAQVDQGPETLLPERVHVGFTADFKQEPVIDSGFGPYALTRLCYETGGIYFTVHPNRNVSRRVNRGEIEAFASDLKHFFDPNVMSRYRPDYVSPEDYLDRIKSSPLRQALIKAARLRPAQGLSRPRTRFVRRSEAQLVGDLTDAQQDAAKLEPMLVRMAQTLEPGMAVREREESPRWRAGYNLAMGRVLAQKVRTETYNAMLAKAKRGLPFQDPNNNTWVLEPSNEISVGSKWEREAETARELLEGVVNEHAGTPWALLAKRELDVPIGWTWKEEFTDLNPPPQRQPGNNNNNNPPPQDEQRRMLEKKPSRPIPKL